MSKLELNLVYQNDDFGQPYSDGTYGIRNDVKTYELLVDGVPVIDLTVEFERFCAQKPNYACACISYDNNFFMQEDSIYVNKGYATIALDTITESLLREGQVPRITLSIAKDNKRSLRVAEKVGYKYIKNNEYSVYHPEATKMIEEGVAYLKDLDPEIYDLQIYAQLNAYRKYLEQCIPNEKTLGR